MSLSMSMSMSMPVYCACNQTIIILSCVQSSVSSALAMLQRDCTGQQACKAQQQKMTGGGGSSVPQSQSQ